MGENYLEMTGSGSVGGVPDRAVLRLGVEHSADDVRTATAGSADAVRRLLDRLRDAGIDDADLQTGSLRIEAGWDHQTARPEGYVASHGLTVRLHDLDAVGELLGVCVDAGGDALRIHELRWALADPTAVEAAAREAAWHDARDKAAQVAVLAGRSLGPVLRVTESPVQDAGAHRMFRLESATADVPVVPGEIDVTAILTVRWALG